MRFIQTFQLYDFPDTLVSLLTAFVFRTLIGAERQYMSRESKNPARRYRQAPGLISGVILANELFRSTTLLAPESQEVGLAISHLVGGEQHGKVAAGAKRVLTSVQRVQ
jgi:hypothetical protein